MREGSEGWKDGGTEGWRGVKERWRDGRRDGRE